MSSARPVGITFPPDAVFLRDAARDFLQGALLATAQGGLMDAVDVARVLNQAKQKYVIVGAHAVNSYSGKPRATVDVDLVAQNPAKARDALLAAFKDLRAQEHPVVIRLLRDGAEAIDIIRPTSGPLFRESLKHVALLQIEGESVSVPRLEMMLALKFSSMIVLTRKLPDRQQDAVDFTRIVLQPAQLDETLLRELGEHAYPGGGNEIMSKVADVRAGRPVSI